MCGKRHKLIDILIITIYEILCKYSDFANITNFLKIHEDYFTKLLNLENDTPSHDALSNTLKYCH